MDWKEFFKPTKWKVIIFLIIFLIFPAKYRGACLLELRAYCPNWIPFGGLVNLIEFIDLIFAGLFDNLSGAMIDALSIIPSIILIIIVSYLISCVIMLIYSKLKK